MAPRGGAGPVLLGIAAGALCSFLVAVAVVRRVGAGETTDELADAAARARALKNGAVAPGFSRGQRSVVFACDAGMGSSVIGAAILQRKLRDAGLDVPVTHAAIGELPASTEIVVVHSSLEERVRRQAPHARVYAVDDFVHSPTYDHLVAVLGSPR